MHTDFRAPWLAVIAAPRAERLTPVAPKPHIHPYHGDGRDVLLQGFHWHSAAGTTDPTTGEVKNWYRVIQDNAGLIQTTGFSWVWFPPASDSLAPEGYIPRRWNVLDSAYGSENELRTALRSLGPVRALADVVLNHRVGMHTAGADFEDPPFADNHAAIACDDESGVGTGNPDTGERHPAGRDLDHTNPGVRAAIKAYLRRLKSVGFRGWRYDLVKGYHGRFVGEYNDASRPAFSVGEVFDQDRSTVSDWVDSTGGRSTAFDFPTRYLLHDSIRSDDYTRMRTTDAGRSVPAGLLGIWPTRAVTFLDNHDTEYRREHEHEYSGGSTRHFAGATVDMGYAYLLTHPGVPCVFWSHFFDWGTNTRRQIRRLIRLRKLAGLRSDSHVEIRAAHQGLYAAVIDGRVAMKLGSRDWNPGPGWRLVTDGHQFAVWMRPA